jgi:hypothetical protein
LCELWSKQTFETPTKLIFHSVEKHPIPLEILTQVLAQWPQFEAWFKPILNVWESSVQQGFLKIELPMNIELNIDFVDIQEWLPQLPNGIAAWFLDGFSPDKNPEMWSENLFEAIRLKTRLKGTFATFTSKGVIKRALWRSGFDVLRTLGYGEKNHRLQGIFQNDFDEYRHQHVLNKAMWNSAASSEAELVLEYLEEGANPRTPDAQGRDLRYYASLGRNPQVLVNIFNFDTQLMQEWSAFELRSRLIRNGRVEILAGLWNHPYFAGLGEYADDFALCAENGHLSCIEFLLSQKWDVNALESRVGETALIRAVNKGHLEIVQHLIKNGAIVNLKSKYGNTALNFATRHNAVKIVKYLLSVGADPMILDSKGKSCLDWARERDHSELIEILS